MLAIAALITTAYAGFVGAPWWGTFLCSLILLVTLATTHVRVQVEPKRLIPAAHMSFGLAPYCLAASLAAYATGQFAQLAHFW